MINGLQETACVFGQNNFQKNSCYFKNSHIMLLYNEKYN